MEANEHTLTLGYEQPTSSRMDNAPDRTETEDVQADDLVGPAEVAERLGVATNTVAKWRRARPHAGAAHGAIGHLDLVMAGRPQVGQGDGAPDCRLTLALGDAHGDGQVVRRRCPRRPPEVTRAP